MASLRAAATTSPGDDLIVGAMDEECRRLDRPQFFHGQGEVVERPLARGGEHRLVLGSFLRPQTQLVSQLNEFIGDDRLVVDEDRHLIRWRPVPAAEPATKVRQLTTTGRPAGHR